jgi:2-C-methyl-D-erythritol 4-phosphate cytidylyltransferase
VRQNKIARTESGGTWQQQQAQQSSSAVPRNSAGEARTPSVFRMEDVLELDAEARDSAYRVAREDSIG